MNARACDLPVAHKYEGSGVVAQEHVDLRERMTGVVFPNTAELRLIVVELISRIRACGRDHPIKVLWDNSRCHAESHSFVFQFLQLLE